MKHSPLVGDVVGINSAYAKASYRKEFLRGGVGTVGIAAAICGFLTALAVVLHVTGLVLDFLGLITVVAVAATLAIWVGYLVFDRQMHKLFDQLFLAEVSSVIFPAIWRDRTNGLGLQHALDDNFDAAYDYACRKYNTYTCRPDSRAAIKGILGSRMREWGSLFDAVITDAGMHPESLRLVPSAAKGDIVEVASEYSTMFFEDQVDR